MTKNNDLLSQMPNKYRKLLYAMYKDQVLGADIIIEIRNDIKAGKKEVLQELLDEVEKLHNELHDFSDYQHHPNPMIGHQLKSYREVIALIQSKIEELK